MSGGQAENTSADELPERADSSAAFQQLSDERRLDILQLLATEGPSSFSTLFEHSDSDSSAGFAYHLRQLAEEFVHQREDDTWELTAPGRNVTQSVQAGAFTTSIDHGGIALDEHCPLCQDQELTLSVEDSIASVSCESCGGSILRLGVPSNWESHTGADPAGALDSYHRNRVRLFSEGVCPDCGGASETTVDAGVSNSSPGTHPESAEADQSLAQFSFACQSCGSRLACPVTLALLDQREVRSFYDDHGEDIADRSVWNVGSEWRERILSTNPWCLLVSSRQDDELLELYVGGDATVHESRRRTIDEETGSVTESERREDVAA